MANTLGIENLSNIISGANNGDIEKLYGGSVAPSVANEKNVMREMQKNGMEVPSVSPSTATDNAHTFSAALRDSVDKVNQYQVESDTAVKELVAGRSKNIHETLLTIERADASLKMMMQVRNKILDAYREIMRMQV